MFDRDIILKYKSETGEEPFILLSADIEYEEDIINGLVIDMVDENTPIVPEQRGYFKIPTEKYITWLENKIK